MPTIAISGYYGLGNLGDEAILAGIVAGFRRASPGVRLTALSADPQATQSLHGIEAVHRFNPAAVWATLRQSDLLISGGGGLLQDTTSLRSPLYYLGILRMASWLGIPSMVFAQGIGPLRRGVVRRTARRVLNRVALATVRDAGSADALRALGVSRPAIHITADASLLMDPPSPQDARRAWQREKAEPPLRPRIGICLRPWGAATSHPWPANLRRALEDLCRSRGASAVLVAMQRPGDLVFSLAMAHGFAARAVSVVTPSTPQEALALIAEMDVVLAMRLHAVVFACMMGVPCVGLAYDPKVRAFLEAVGQPCLALDAEPRAVAEAVGSALDERPERSAGLATAMDPLRQAALRNIELALALLARR
jgi:polysaccharide pyruvyl transferase CsaB